MAGTEDGGQDPDWTIGALLGRLADGKTFVADVARIRTGVARRDAEIEAVAREDARQYRGRVRWWMEKETGIGGADRTAILVRRIQNAGVSVQTEAATSNKVIRAEPLASAVGAGNVLLCPGEWRDPLRAEAADFPTGKHDDIVDALSGAFNKLALGSSGTPPVTAAADETAYGSLPADTFG